MKEKILQLISEAKQGLSVQDLSEKLNVQGSAQYTCLLYTSTVTQKKNWYLAISLVCVMDHCLMQLRPVSYTHLPLRDID